MSLNKFIYFRLKCWPQLLVAAAITFLSAFLNSNAKAEECIMLKNVSFRFVLSNDKLQKLLRNVMKDNKVDSIEGLDRLAYCYKALGRKYKTIKFEDKRNNRNIVAFRFDLDQTSWILPSIVPAPGASNGKYFVVFGYDIDQKTILISIPKGEGQWLKLE